MKSCSVSDGLAIFKALGSPVRVQILRLIQEREGLNIKQIAQNLKIPVTTLSPHLNLLAEAGLIEFRDESHTHGTQKRCYFIKDWDQLLVNMALYGPDLQTYSAEIGVGHFSDFSVTPTCGMATSTSFVGQLDQPRYFIHPGSRQARIVWFTTGYLEYILPNFIPDHSAIEELTVSFEISSEAPRFCDVWPSDITFSLNGVILGTWISPGDYGDRRGKYNPSWWFPFLNQYGLLKKLTITPEGTFLDAEKLSDVSTRQLALTDQSVMKLRFSVLPGAEHPGGCTLFGAGFGDYNQHIRIIIGYHPENI